MFRNLDTSQESIVDASDKLMKMAKDPSFKIEDCLKKWQQSLEKAKKPLALIYLANDLIQRSKIKKSKIKLV